MLFDNFFIDVFGLLTPHHERFSGIAYAEFVSDIFF